MRTTVAYVFLTAIRDRLFVGLLIGIVTITLLSLFFGSTSLVENKQMGIVFTAAANRILLILGLVVFVCFHLRYEFDAKEIDLLLSRPISRVRVVIAYWLSFALIALFMALPVLAAVAVWGDFDSGGYLLWSVTLLLELMLMVAVALFTGFMLKSAVSSVLTCVGFYVLARMAGLFVMTTESRVLFRNEYMRYITEYAMKAISAIMPRLDMFGKSEWLLYGAQRSDTLLLCFTQTAIYIPLLLVATMIDFQRREF